MSIQVMDERRRFETFEQNITWFRVHYEDLKKEYPNRFVAINKGKVIEYANTLDGLLRKLRKQYDDIAVFAIEFVSGSKAELIVL